MVRHVPKNVERILNDLEKENDRVAAIVGVSLVEHFLQEAIQAKLHRITSKTDKERLFAPNGLCGTLETKTLLAFGVGIVGPKTRTDLDILRKIRNEFAHNMNSIDFDSAPISQWVDSLSAHLIMGGSPDHPRREKVRMELYTLVGGFQMVLDDSSDARDFVGP